MLQKYRQPDSKRANELIHSLQNFEFLTLNCVAQKSFHSNKSGSYSLAELIVLWVFNIQSWFIRSSIRNWIAYANEANIVNKDSPIALTWTWSTFFAFVLTTCCSAITDNNMCKHSEKTAPKIWRRISRIYTENIKFSIGHGIYYSGLRLHSSDTRIRVIHSHPVGSIHKQAKLQQNCSIVFTTDRETFKGKFLAEILSSHSLLFRLLRYAMVC